MASQLRAGVGSEAMPALLSRYKEMVNMSVDLATALGLAHGGLPQSILAVGAKVTGPAQILDLFDALPTIRAWMSECVLVH